MFGKSLFKQSCKANGVMWIVITVAVCFMLSCVMLIAGNGDLGNTKVVIEDAVVEGELKAQTEDRAINYYEISVGALEHFDSAFKRAYIPPTDTAPEYQAAALQSAYAAALNGVKSEYYPAILEQNGCAANDTAGQELMGITFYALYPPLTDEQGKPVVDSYGNVTYQFDQLLDYDSLGIEKPDYAPYFSEILTDNAEHAANRAKYAMTHSSNFLAGNMVKTENVELMIAMLAEYNITPEKFHEFGYDQFDFVHDIAENTVVDYRANLAYLLDKEDLGNMTEEEAATLTAQIKKQLHAKLSKGLLASLPAEVSDALKEIGSADLYGTLVGSIFFKMAGLLLPIIYVIMTSNALIAGQVDSGSMAYVLSTGTKRREVACTQALFLVGSLFAMFACTSVTSMICLALVDVNTKLNFGKLLLINLGAFFVMFAMSGICYLASCVFNRSKHSMALGGGLNMFFLVATMLGLFGSEVLPSIIRMKALNAFNYLSIISLFDVISILEGTYAFLWKWGILIAVGVICYIVGSLRFQKKDLPL